MLKAIREPSADYAAETASRYGMQKPYDNSRKARLIAAEVQRILGAHYCGIRGVNDEDHQVHCCKPPGHDGPHVLLAEAPMVREVAFDDTLMDKRRLVVRPKDGFWLDTRPENLEVVTRKQHLREALARPQNRRKRGESWNIATGRWERECRKCLGVFPSEECPGRAVCRECRLAQTRRQARAQYRAPDFSFDKQTYRLGAFGAAPTEVESSDAFYFLMARLDQQFSSETDGDLASARVRWAAVLASLPD